MTNYDKYADFIRDEMLERGSCQFGVTKNGEPKLCRKMECKDCAFDGIDMTCQDFRRHWLNQEFKPPITEQLMETIDECHKECADTVCRECVYYTLNSRCTSARIIDALISKFNITNKEDEHD